MPQLLNVQRSCPTLSADEFLIELIGLKSWIDAGIKKILERLKIVPDAVVHLLFNISPQGSRGKLLKQYLLVLPKGCGYSKVVIEN